jgi:hypothetical protein
MGRWQMASETVERGQDEGPGAYVLPADQADPIAAAELADILILQGVEVHQATEDFTAVPQAGVWFTPEEGTLAIPEWQRREMAGAGDADAEEGDAGAEDAMDAPSAEPRTFPAGSWVVFGAQPARAAVLDLLEAQNRRLQREWPGGPFVRSYDGAAYTMPMQMGVESVRVDADEVGAVRRAEGARYQPPAMPTAQQWYAFSARVTRNYQTVNRLIDAGVGVSRGTTPDGPVFLVRASEPQGRALLSQLSAEIGTAVVADPEGLGDVVAQRAARIGLYQGWAGAMDEGWTRFVFDDFDYPYVSLGNEDVRAEDLRERFDVIVIPSEIPLNRLIEGSTSENDPPMYRGGIGEEGVENLQAFVRAGGTLVTLERADELVIERFGVPVRNALDGLGSDELFLPSSLLRLEVDTDNALAFGMPEEVAAKWAGGRAYEPADFGGSVGRVEAVGRWPDEADRVLMSGMLYGAEHLAGKGAILDVEYGDGRILMYGFRVQHRGQTHGTFKLLFNALLRDDPRAATEE